MSLWKKSKSRKLHSLVMASILSFSVTCSVFAESFWSSIGTGEYSWDRDWTLSLSNCGNDGVNSSAFGSYLQYDASSGQLTLVYIAEIASENNYTNRYYTNLGDAKAFFGGMSEEDIKDLIDDAIHNVDGDQTVNGSQDITGDGFRFGLPDCEWWADRHGRLITFLKSNKKWAALAAQTEINNDERGI